MIKLLDCTLRDGGYYNEWDFSDEIVQAYVEAMNESGMDVVEIGFRHLSQREFVGAFAYSTDDYLISKIKHKNFQLAVMIDAKEVLASTQGVKNTIHSLFDHSTNSPVDIVRIAIRASIYPESRQIAQELKALGYSVCLNLMQISQESLGNCTQMAKQIQEWGCVDVLYFADSLGSMDAGGIQSIITFLRKGWSGDLGIHTHNNMGKALGNSIQAVENGVSWVDGTLLGMGRGAGNAQIEYLMLELMRMNKISKNPNALFPLVVGEFEELRKKYGWGSSLLYYLSAMYGIHPTYVQEMLQSKRNQKEHLLKTLDVLKNTDASNYTPDSLTHAINKGHAQHHGTWSADNWLRDGTILILGSGPSIKRYKSDLESFIQSTRSFVLSLNTNDDINPQFISAYASCNQSRLLMDAAKYQKAKKPIFAPRGIFPESVKHIYQSLETRDYGVSIEENVFRANSTDCSIPYSLVAAYALALSLKSGAQNILLAGFDGFDAHDARQTEMNHVFELISKSGAIPRIVSITPSTYNIEKESMYSPSFVSAKASAKALD